MKIMISLFRDCKSTSSCGQVDLWDWLLDQDKYREVVERIRNCTDDKVRRKLKETVPAVTISCICSARKTDKITGYTGLMCIDIDGKDNPEMSMDRIKEQIAKLEYVMYCGLSIGGKGLFCIIPVMEQDNHKRHFKALQKDFYDMGIVIDKACSDIVRLRLCSFDPNPYVNRSALRYTSVSDEEVFIPKQRRTTRTKPGSVNDHPSEIPGQDKKDEPEFMAGISRELWERLASSELPWHMGLTDMPKKKMVLTVIDHFLSEKVDITADYNDWFDIGCILNNLFQFEGLEKFHEVSALYPYYDFAETQHLFNRRIVKGKYRRKTDRLLEIVSKYDPSFKF